MVQSRSVDAHLLRRFFGGRLAMIMTLLILAAVCAGAQAPPGADTLSPASITNSLAVLNRLRQHVASDGRNAIAWHRLGMVAWSLAERAKTPEGPREIDAKKLSRLADTALRVAAQLAPQDVSYRLAVGRFLLGSGLAITRAAARGHFEKALDLARAGATPPLRAEAALAYGRTFWWRYDVFANRRMPSAEGFTPSSVTDAMQPLARTAAIAEEFSNLQAAAELLGMGAPLTITSLLKLLSESSLAGDAARDAMRATAPEARARYSVLPQTSMKAARELIETNTSPLPPDVTGAADFERAFALFHEAYEADPTFPGAYRAVAMIYADRGLWNELESVARNQLRVAPRDSLAWMSLGLATHRLEKENVARAAFDSALLSMSPKERDRLDNWQRVMPLRRSILRSEGTEAQRSAVEQMFWMVASPFWADEGNQTKVEFLSRVAYAELRWTVEEFRLSGADTDRGDIHVRYGPPEKIALIGPRASDNAADIVTFWMYSSGLMFAFRGMPTFATAHTAYGDGAIVDAIRQVQPVRWDNVSAPEPDTLPVQVARFRAGRDSVDVIVAARLADPAEIKRTMSVASAVKRHFWLVVPGSTRRYSASGDVDTAGVYSMSRRVEPGSLVYRVEAFGETAKRGGRATGVLDANTGAFPLTGFGISDMLLGTNATPPDRTTTRWNAVRMSPLAGAIARGADLSIVWENYEFAAQDGEARYEVAITLKRVRSSAGRIVAKISGAIDPTVRTLNEDDRVVFRFDRAVPHAAAFADQLSISLGETPAGTYSLTLELTDRVSGSRSSRETTVVIRS